MSLDGKTLPLQFKREAPGIYVSACGLFRIHRTCHRGYGVSATGRSHWHTTHLPSGDAVNGAWRGHGVRHYELSLESAIRGVHREIGMGIARWMSGLVALAQNEYQRQLDAERALEEQQIKRGARLALEAKIRDAILRSPAGVFAREDRDALVRGIADAVEAPLR